MIWVNITTDDGEVLERFAVTIDDQEDPLGADVAGSIKECIERRFNVLEPT